MMSEFKVKHYTCTNFIGACSWQKGVDCQMIVKHQEESDLILVKETLRVFPLTRETSKLIDNIQHYPIHLTKLTSCMNRGTEQFSLNSQCVCYIQIWTAENRKKLVRCDYGTHCNCDSFSFKHKWIHQLNENESNFQILANWEMQSTQIFPLHSVPMSLLESW